MKIHPPAPTARDDIRRLGEHLKPLRTAMLTLHEDGAGLTSRPMTVMEMDADGALWMLTSRSRMSPLLGAPGSPARAANLSFVDAGDDDYLSIAGQAELVDDAARRRELWSAMARPWFDGPDDPDLVLLRVAPGQADYWDGPDTAVQRVLTHAASIAAGREIGMGDKEVLHAGVNPLTPAQTSTAG